MESVWDRVCYYSSATWTELVFWGDVMVEFLGLDKSKFHSIVEAREREIKEEEREEDIQTRRKMQKRRVIYYD
jgi:hypothetical protein